MKQTFEITAKAENILRILQKLSSLMTRKSISAQVMQVKENIANHESYLFLSIYTDEKRAFWLLKQLRKFVDLYDLKITMKQDFCKSQQQEFYNLKRGFLPY